MDDSIRLDPRAALRHALGGYILLGAFHMASPRKVLPVYRAFLGRRRFERNAWRFEQISAGNWKMMGVAYILLGLMLAWAVESIL